MDTEGARRTVARDRRLALLRLLADGRFQSGERLAAALGVSRAAVWKQLREIGRSFGIEVDAVRGRGYRLAHRLELLDRDQIASLLRQGTAARLSELEVIGTVDSTNARVAGRRLDDGTRGVACLAEQQTAGRGRRGRAWVSPFGANIYLSLVWRFDSPPIGLAGLSLAVGVAVAQALTDVGAAGATLKWPNDVLWDGRKLSGILVELSGESEGPTHAIIGVGVNVRMPRAAGSAIDQPWTDLAVAAGNATPSRNLVAARLLDRLVAACVAFRDEGLAPFLVRWRELDGLAGRPVRVTVGERVVDGTALGVAPSGALRLATADGEREFHGGEVSLRPQAMARGA